MTETPKPVRKIFGHFDLFLIPVVLLIFIFKMVFTKPKDEKRRPANVDNTPVVKVTSLAETKLSRQVQTLGVVRPLNQTILTSEVTGEVIELSPDFQTGKRLKKGAFLLQIESSDYEAALATAELNYAKEKALQEQAVLELEIVGSLETASDLAKRIPYLKEAEIALKQAQRNLEKCRVVAPYDCEIMDREVSFGEKINAFSRLGELFSTEEIEIVCEISEEEKAKLSGTPLASLQVKSLQDGGEHSFVVKEMASILNAETRTVSLVLKPKTEGLDWLVGSYHPIQINATSTQKIKTYAVPNQAVFESQLVCVNRENEINLYPIKVWERGDVNSTISIDLKEDALPERILASKLALIVEGSLVRIVE